MVTTDHGAHVSLRRRARDVACCAILHNTLIRVDGLIMDEVVRNPIFDEMTDRRDILVQGHADSASGSSSFRTAAVVIRQALVHAISDR